MEQPWLAIYRQFDDDTLAALASVGLLRRAAKDVEACKVAWDSPPDSKHGQVRCDGQLVRIGEGGPARAQCDCAAPGMCKHILAAALWLRQAPAAGPAQTAADALAEVLALPSASAFKSAGIAATRKAAALVNAIGPVRLQAQSGVLVIELPDLELACRFIAGAGFSGMISEAPAASRATMHLLALVAVWRAHGRAFDWPDGVDTAPACTDASLTDAERQFLARLRPIILEVCRSGWSHVSDVTPAQLRAFGMSARVESFPRLAGLLRTLAGTAQLLADRDGSSDERQAIKLAARIEALCHALEHATGEALLDLRGRVRRSFEGDEGLELLPLGAHWWERRSGARGLTISFWDHASASVMQTVLARADATDRAFSRDGAWAHHALWRGTGAACTLFDGSLMLEGARLSNDNRLSLTGDTSARTLPALSEQDERWASIGFDDWRDLASKVSKSAGLRGEAIDCLVLKPSQLDAPQLDEVGQVLRWTLRDRDGTPLTLRLPCDAHHHTRIANIEAWAASGTPIKAVLARLERDVHGSTLEPVSLMVSSDGNLRAISLDFVAPKSTSKTSFITRIARMLKAKDASVPWAPGPAHLEWVERLLGILESKAMTGRLHLVGEDRADLTAIRQLLRGTGIDAVADALDRYLATPDTAQALSLVHLCHTCIELDTSFIYR